MVLADMMVSVAILLKRLAQADSEGARSEIGTVGVSLGGLRNQGGR